MSPTLARAVRPLEDAWQEVIDAVLKRRGAPSTKDVQKLAPRLVELSHAYNAGLAGDAARVRVPLDARIAFSFARDVPKGAGAVRELIGTGALAASADRVVRIVDLGAGLGAMTWGIARALAAGSAAPPRIEALLVDEDGDALAAAESIAREVTAHPDLNAPAIRMQTRKERIAPGMKLPEADVVVLGQVLSELDVAMDPRERASKHAALVSDLLARVVAPDGALVIVEPALRERTRHLHAVRDVLVAAGTTVFAPCLHASGCPVLATDGDWCHEDLPVDLPAWVVPLARAAGLRWQRVTFSHLVLRRDDRRLVDELTRTGPRVHLRVISELMRTKGKAEVFACTAEGARLRLRRLDRDASDTGPGAAATTAWSALGRGDVVTLTQADQTEGRDAAATRGPIDERGRVSGTAQIDVWPIRK
ncbi:MAG: Methyltransferase [Labilithrix sp.]|nr:Methyltransferase [Labilithrix sp.]